MTLLVFSGRKDPEWTVLSSDINYTKIQKLLSDASINGFAYHPDGMPDRLGYRGFLVQDTATMKQQLIVGPETKQLQLLLLSTMPIGLLKSGNIRKVETEIRSGAVKVGMIGKRSKRDALPFDGDFWNINARAQLCNNCYNFATFQKTDTFAIPGLGGGFPLEMITDDEVKKAVINDGLAIEIFNKVPTEKNTHLVALYVKKG